MHTYIGAIESTLLPESTVGKFQPNARHVGARGNYYHYYYY